MHFFLSSLPRDESGEQGGHPDGAMLSFHAARACRSSSLVFDLRGSTRAFNRFSSEKTISNSACERCRLSFDSLVFFCCFCSLCFSCSSTFDGWGGNCSARMTYDTNPVFALSIVLYSVFPIHAIVVFHSHTPHTDWEITAVLRDRFSCDDLTE